MKKHTRTKKGVFEIMVFARPDTIKEIVKQWENGYCRDTFPAQLFIRAFGDEANNFTQPITISGELIKN